MMFKSCRLILNLTASVIFRFNSSFIPKHEPVQLSDANILNKFIKKHKKILVLTGIMESHSIRLITVVIFVLLRCRNFNREWHT